MKSEFGTWDTIDLEMLDVRVKEVYSLDKLSGVSQTEVRGGRRPHPGPQRDRHPRAVHGQGPHRQVAPLEGLKAMTIWAAEQYGEQAAKGTLEAGKLADTLEGIRVEPETGTLRATVGLDHVDLVQVDGDWSRVVPGGAGLPLVLRRLTTGLPARPCARVMPVR